MSRATAVLWFNLVASLLAVAPLARAAADALPVPARPQLERQVAQAGVGTSQARAALSNAIESQRRGDFDIANVYLQSAHAGAQDLTPAERTDLGRLMQQNTQALQARREGSQVLAQVDLFVQNGRVSEAAALLKKLSATFAYLKSEDQQRYRSMEMRLRTQLTAPSASPSPRAAVPAAAPAATDPATLARTRIQEARAVLNQGDFETAEKLAREAASLGAVVPPGGDTPEAILADVTRLSSNPQALVRAARLALQRRQFDRAENYARRAEICSTVGSFPPWADSPSQVRADVKAARAQMSSAPGVSAAAPVTPNVPAMTPAAANGASQTPAVPPDQVRMMVRRARQSLAAGDLTQARRISQQLRALNARLPDSEDNPLRLEADLAQAEATASKFPRPMPRDVTPPPAPVPPVPLNLAAQAGSSLAPSTMTPLEDAEGWLKQGRNMLLAGKLDDAARCAARARAITSASWGLFSDSPAKLQRDVDQARSKRDREESYRILSEARRLFEQRDYDRAQTLAYQALKLHGNYSWYEQLHDYPEKLLAEIQTAREQARRNPLPPPVIIPTQPPASLVQGTPAPARTPGAQTPPNVPGVPTMPPAGGARPTNPTAIASNNPSPKPSSMGGLPMVGAAPIRPPQSGGVASGAGVPPAMVPPRPANLSHEALEAHARLLIARAKEALQKGDAATARLMAEEVRKMPLTLCKTDSQALDSIYKAIEKTAQPAPLPVLATNVPNLPTAPGVNPPPRPVGTVTPPVASTRPAPSVMAPRNPQVADAGKVQAQRLLAEARTLQRNGRLIEAREKVLEARRYNAVFGPNEDNPSLAYQQLAGLAVSQIDHALGRASEEAAYGIGDPQVRYQNAEKRLLEARQLANQFGLDPRPVEQKLAWVSQLRRGGSSAVVANPGGAGVPPAGPGQVLLEKARLELRKGQLAAARQIALDAYNGHYGVEQDALAMIRSVEAEEANQRRLQVQRTFDAAYTAYVRRRDYEHASLMFRALDPQMLDPGRREKLKELLMTPELRLASHVAMADNNPEGRGARDEGRDTPSSPGSSASSPSPLTPRPSPLGDGAGHARASDTNLEASLLERTRALREVNFQRLRSRSIDVQKDAAEKFRAGQSEEALNVLTDFLAQLENEQQLEAGQLTMLKRPIEVRLNNFRSLASQQELQRGVKGEHDHFLKENEQIRTTEENKQKTLSQLMKQFNELYREGKYVEAEAIAMRGKELDPDNGVATAAVYMARNQARRHEYDVIKEEKAETFRRGLNDAETEGPFTTSVHFDPDSTARSRNRKPIGPIQVGHLNAKEQDIERKLSLPVSPLNFVDQPLRQVIADLRDLQNLNIYIDTPALAEQGISLESPVTVKLDNISLKSALNLILHQVHLGYVIKDEVLQITTEENLSGRLRTQVYQVADLVIPVPNFGDIQHPVAPDLPGTIQTNSPSNGTTPTPAGVPFGMTGGTATGIGTSASQQGGSSFASAQQGGGVVVNQTASPTQEQALIKLIVNSVQPRSWQEMGGKGTIDYNPMTMALVINQTPDLQEQVAELLQALRRLQDQEVAIEVRFITIAEDFFERIGVNFNMNIVNQSQTSRFQPEITSGQFAPAGYINEFHPKNFLAGLQPAGTFTNSLDIPITTQTFQQAIPPFGGYPGIPGYGGIAFGLGFLSDIQVFLFLEAVQGDVRTNVMQAPKLTMFNGQTASLNVLDYQFFTTGVQVQNQMGQFTYSPLVRSLPLGVSLFVQPTISADRRFVRMSMQPQLTNLATPLVELFPVVVPIFPLFDGTATGQPVVFTQFIQQPVITTITVQTTVVVPDGGTVLMGGLKRLSEGRNEYGPPILSKIPFVNRLFKNVGYGRDVHSLLLMVTPRIIIQEEEEERQTGYRAPPNVIER